MSSSNTSIDLIASLNNVSTLLNRYLPIFIYIFGTIGNFLNVLVLGQRTLRSKPSAIFFLISSIAGIIVIISGLTSRMLSGYGADLTLTIGWICKIRNVTLYSSRTVVLWMIVLATIDRWLSSSIIVKLRQMSNLKNTQRSILVVLLYTCILNAPILYCYEANLVGTLRGCYGSTSTCSLITDLIYAFGTTLLPLILMIIFGLLTIKNIHNSRSRVQAANGIILIVAHTITRTVPDRDNKNRLTNVSRQISKRNKDRYLLKMLFVQVTLLFLFTCPHAIQKVYSSFTSNLPTQSLQNAIQNLIFTLFTLLTFIASGMPFYIYTLTGGNLFRNTFIDLVKITIQKILCH